MSDASIGAKPHYLVGDIGGTNARFAYVTPEQAQPQSLAKYRVADFQNFDEVMARLITDWQALGLPEAGPAKTCLAVAAPPHLETISFTNSPWRFDRALLGRYLTNSSIEIINDLSLIHI